MNGEENTKRGFRGPIEDHTWPTRLPAHVVQPGPFPRVHGYDVLRDLSANYTFAEVALLTLTGEAPTRPCGRAFAVGLAALAPMTIGEAPSHAAYLARLCGGTSSSALGLGALVSAERARELVRAHEAWLRWLADPQGDPPLLGEDTTETKALLAGLPTDFALPWPATVVPGLAATALGVLWQCGLRAPAQLEAAIVMATLPALAAEMAHGEGADIRDYPIDTPQFVYEEDVP